MNSMKLLEAIGSIRDKYIAEAHEPIEQKQKTIPLRRMLFIAAILAMMLLLAGCVAVFLGLRDLNLGTFPVDMGFGQTVPGNFLSLQGYAGSPGYQASKEWMEFQQEYDPNGEMGAWADANGYHPPAEYESYSCFSPDMEAKIGEICEKYNLHPLGPVQFTEDPQQMLSNLGVAAIGSPEVQPTWGYYYADGTFQLEGEWAAPGADPTSFQYRCVQKTAFDGVYLNIGDPGQYTEWSYTTKDGTPVLLALNQQKGLLIADLDTCFISVNILQTMDQAKLEAVADCFTFDYRPQPIEIPQIPEPTALKPAQNQDGTDLAAYQSYISTQPQGQTYGLRDLDGDGTMELLVGRPDGSLVAIVASNGQEVARVNEDVQLYLCQGNVICHVFTMGDVYGVTQWNSYYHLEGTDLILLECLLMSNPTDGEPSFGWSEVGGAGGEFWLLITEEEYQDCAGKYPVLHPELTPVDSGAAPTEALVSGSFLPDSLADILNTGAGFYSCDHDQIITVADYCAAFAEDTGVSVSVPEYTRVDLDGDWQEELVLRLRTGTDNDYGVLVLHDVAGMAVGHTLAYRQMFLIKEDGTFCYSGGADNDGVARLEFPYRDSWQYKELPDAGQDSKPDAAWQPYPAN